MEQQLLVLLLPQPLERFELEAQARELLLVARLHVDFGHVSSAVCMRG